MSEKIESVAGDGQELSLAIYQQRRLVELLRQRVYATPPILGSALELQGTPQTVSQPTAQNLLSDSALLTELLAAEEKLSQLEQALQEQEPGLQRGLLYDSIRERGAPLQEKMGRDTTGVEASISLRLSHIPSGIVHLFNPVEKPLISVKINNPDRQIARLRVTSWVEQYSAACVNTLELYPGDEKEINQLPVFFAERLRQVTEITQASLRVHIQHLSGVTEMERSFPIWLLARSTAYLGVLDPQSGKTVDLSPYLGAWVTPNALEVMELLRRAVDLHPQKQVVGYQADRAGVEAQVKAIFQAVKQTQVQYVNSVFCFGRTGGEYIQRIRLPRETLATRSANCIDGTLLMASLLEAASLNPAIVLVPGHAFLGWEVQKGSNEWDYLETTLVGAGDFELALQVGRARAAQHRAKAARDGNEKIFRLLPVSALRVNLGVLPME